MKRLSTIFILFIITIIKINSQTLGGGLVLGFPEGEFKDNLKKTSVGFNLDGVWFLNQAVPVGIGLNLAFSTYGSETRNAPWSTTIPDVTVEVERSYNILHGHLFFRITTPHSLLKPYVDLLFGGGNFYTETKVVNKKNNEEVSSSNNMSDWAWSYGAGAGLMYRVHQTENEDSPGSFTRIYIDFKVRYLKGTEAEYLTPRSVVVNPNGSVDYYPSRSKTDMITAHLGVQFQFDVMNLIY